MSLPEPTFERTDYDLSTPECPTCLKEGKNKHEFCFCVEIRAGQFWDTRRQRPKTMILKCRYGHEWESLASQQLKNNDT